MKTQELQTLAQLEDNLEITLEKLEKAYQENDSEGFKNAKSEIIIIKNPIKKTNFLFKLYLILFFE